MYKIISKKSLTNNIFLMEIEAPRVAKAAKPGQFIIIKNDEVGERIPLTIADYNREKGTVTIVFQTVGQSTKKLAEYNPGEYVADFVGPLGKPSEFIHESVEELKKKKFIFIAGGVGAAPVYPQVKWMHENGINVDVILGSRSKELLIYEEELKSVSGNLYVTTDDGSYGAKGTGSDMLKELVNNQGKKYDHAVIIGPMIMMKFTSMLTKELNIPTIVSLNPIMVDGTGMCGACRVTVGNEVKFACVDGPEFDGHLVNYDESMRRQALYKTEEGRTKLEAEEGNTHSHGGCGCRGDK
ncbi:sulfide/dihydroorotate dehydrogenase-like FAD/NAD-binding protein [uncultured Clostridium sp.]|uniref:sulfide/dihydroorotate dehydrogenase-like FAD/NAD-binding protein n=1 Tax=uncultured Clostridium sp. TaxID=59620 RepID=UPI0028E245A6|nr:sulfide/dihydroorotate dehydrogenase-like FAD/NAD-binding protein [uncultured Clostridium sp.]